MTNLKPILHGNWGTTRVGDYDGYGTAPRRAQDGDRVVAERSALALSGLALAAISKW